MEYILYKLDIQQCICTVKNIMPGIRKVVLVIRLMHMHEVQEPN